jgi:transcriptional regulator with XRE-family HTH domain
LPGPTTYVEFKQLETSEDESQRDQAARQAGTAIQHINKTFGEIVRHLRHKAGMTIEELALASKVSRAMLSSVERGEKNPTLSVLTGIASGLNVTLSRLMAEGTSSSVASVIRRQHRMIFRDQETGIERHLLSPTHLDTGVELVEHVLPSGQIFAGGLRLGMTTDKYVVVQEGTLTDEIDGRSHELIEEDSMYFRISDDYCFVNNSRRSCRYYLFIVHRR